jgi:hypothetical protein
MTQQQFVEEIKQLSVADRLALIEIISRSLREDLGTQEARVPAPQSDAARHATQNSGENQAPISRHLLGVVKFEGDPPTDEEVKDAYADYLMEKYS